MFANLPQFVDSPKPLGMMLMEVVLRLWLVAKTKDESFHIKGMSPLRDVYVGCMHTIYTLLYT